MFYQLPTKLAEKYSLDLMNELESTDLMSGFEGMFGVLVCKEKNEDGSLNEKDIVLRSFSGQFNGVWNHDGFVPALLNQEEYDKVVAVNDKKIHELTEVPENETAEERIRRDEKRIALCNESLARIYSLYNFTCFDQTKKTFSHIKEYLNYNSSHKELKLFPTGVGDCCAPKLFSFAFSKNLQPVSLAEFYWGKPNTNFEPRKFYPPCDAKCSLILPSMLGLNILYRDDAIIVVNKPSGLLAVPGRGPDKQDCIVNRIKNLFPECIEQPSSHRLDMDTSGLLVLGFTTESQRSLSIQFQNGEVEKKYIAVIDGVLGVKCNFENHAADKLSPNGLADFNPEITPVTTEGQIELKFRLDVDNRPHQIYDEVNGKNGITLWKKLRIWKMNGRNVTSVEFEPQTGRTHQLRLASASKLGFGIPIVGDNLYGSQDEGQRLLLHSSYLSFNHPVTGEKMEFFCEPDFRY